MNILVLGSNGQLGKCLYESSTTFLGAYFFLKKDECDITNEVSIRDAVETFKPNVIINCAAYTDVNKSENDGKMAAYSVNAIGPLTLAKVCNENNVALIHISTDYVFDGTSSRPYSEDDKCNPLNVYGMSKFLGEQAILRLMSGVNSPKFTIIRTSWLFSEYCKNAFIKIPQKLINGENVSIFENEIGTPTYARDLADFIAHLLHTEDEWAPIYHFANAGVASRYDVAYEMSKYLIGAGYQIGGIARITPTEELSPRRPQFSALSTVRSKKIMDGRHWKEALLDFMTRAFPPNPNE